VPLVGAVDCCRLVDIAGDSTQRRIEDEHVVADEGPGHDIADAREHQAGPKEVGRLQAEEAEDLRSEAELPAEDVPPHQRGDDSRHGIRQKEPDADNPAAGKPSAIDGEGNKECDADHDGHLHGKERENA
jgi:hypothetical protein